MAECRNCGSHVSHDFARVLGDEDDNVHRCQNCAKKEHLRDGQTADPDRETRSSFVGVIPK